jgi:15-cis-phytoene synthase
VSAQILQELPKDLKNCGIQKHSKSFALASQLLNPTARHDVHAMYQLFRGMDDLADGCCHSSAAEMMFESLRDALQHQRPHAWLSAAHTAALAKLDDIGHRALLRLLDTLRADLTPARLETEDQLLRYCFGAAGTVGLILLPALGVRDARGRSSAAALGIAMQLSNIARDVVEDARLGRRYLPVEYFAHLPELHAIAAGEPAALRECAPAVARVIALADKFYELALSGCHWIPTRNRWAVISAARIYRQIGWDIRSGLHAHSFATRVSVSAAAKLRCVVAAAVDVIAVRGVKIEPAPDHVPRGGAAFVESQTLAAIVQHLLTGMWSGSEPCPNAYA